MRIISFHISIISCHIISYPLIHTQYHNHLICTEQRYSVLSFRVPVHNFVCITDIISINISLNTHTCKYIHIYDQMLLTIHFLDKQSTAPVRIYDLSLHVLYLCHANQFTIPSNSLFYVQMQFMYIMFYCFILFIHVTFYQFIVNAFLHD